MILRPRSLAMRAGERSARGLALIIFGFSRRACGPRRYSSPRCLKSLLLTNPPKLSPQLVPNLPASGDMRVPQRQQCWPARELHYSFLSFWGISPYSRDYQVGLPSGGGSIFFNLSYDYKPNWIPLSASSGNIITFFRTFFPDFFFYIYFFPHLLGTIFLQNFCQSNVAMASNMCLFKLEGGCLKVASIFSKVF